MASGKDKPSKEPYEKQNFWGREGAPESFFRSYLFHHLPPRPEAL
jgi:hypothetical protein